MLLKIYDDYLKIYDLHKERKTFRQIAKIIYPGYEPEDKDAFRPMKEKIKENLKSCKKLVYGGYKEIY